jgi:site-specific DNA recombinase
MRAYRAKRCAADWQRTTAIRLAHISVRIDSGGYRRDHLRALAQRVEVGAKEVHIMGSKSVLLRTLVAVSSATTAGFGVPSSVPKWRARREAATLARTN